MEDIYVYIYKIYIYFKWYSWGYYCFERDNLVERIVYFEGARARRKYDGEVVLRVVETMVLRRLMEVSMDVGRRWKISCNCDYVDRGGQAVDTLTRELNPELI